MSNGWQPNPHLTQHAPVTNLPATQVVYGFAPPGQTATYWQGPLSHQGLTAQQIQAQQQSYATACQQAAAAAAAPRQATIQQAMAQGAPPQVNPTAFQAGGYQHHRAWNWPGWMIPPPR